jgi:biopolymer transport protein ExbD
MKLKRRSLQRGRVEIIPMIDTLLILLIFYMSFSTFARKEKRIDAKLPLLSTTVPPAQAPLDIVLHINGGDKITVNGVNTFDMLSLRDALAQLSSIGQDLTIVIEAEPDASYQDVIDTLDACAQAHQAKVAFRPLVDKVGTVR